MTARTPRLARTSQAGTGYVNPAENGDPLPGRVEDAAARDPVVVVVSAGADDFRPRYGLGEIRESVQRTYRQLRKGLPQARIVAVGPLWTGRSAPEKVVTIERMVKSAASQVDAEFVGTTRLSDALAARVSADGVNPNDAGRQLVARRVSAALS